MSNSRTKINALLNDLVATHIAPIRPGKPLTDEEGGGTFNHTILTTSQPKKIKYKEKRIGWLQLKTPQAYLANANPIHVALSIPNHLEKSDQAIAAFKLMTTRLTSEDYLFVNKINIIATIPTCKKLSLRASSDLFSYIKEYQHEISADVVKNLIGQMIFMINAFHRHNLAYRDIKVDNTLVEIDETGYIHLKAHDFDEVIAVEEKTGHARPEVFYDGVMPSHLWAPEYIKMIMYVNSQANQLEIETKDFYVDNGTTVPVIINTPYVYGEEASHLDLKACDCYSLGRTLQVIAAFALPKKHYERALDPILNDLIHSFLNSDPKKRLTVEEAFNHPFFGATKEEREIFFNHLKMKAHENNMGLTIDKPWIREIYTDIAKLKIEFDKFSELPESHQRSLLLEDLKRKTYDILQKAIYYRLPSREINSIGVLLKDFTELSKPAAARTNRMK